MSQRKIFDLVGRYEWHVSEVSDSSNNVFFKVASKIEVRLCRTLEEVFQIFKRWDK